MSNSLRRGSHALPLSKGQSNFMEIRMPGGNGLVGLGLIQSGFMHSNLNFIPENSGGGKIENTFSPSINIMPKSSAQTDAVWILLSSTNSQVLWENFIWATAFVRKDDRKQAQPAGWVTVTDDDSIDTLLTTARKWNLKSINHALVPGTWQSGGIDEGEYALSIAQVAQVIIQTGLAPGITVDPLSASRKYKDLTIEAKDGTHWLDLRKPKARAYGVKQLGKLVGWNYEFFVINLSLIPDDVLQTMNITRAVADLVAFEMMTEAAGRIPVFPNTGHSIGNDTTGWQAVQLATRSNETYHYPTGPIRLDLRNVSQLNDTVKTIVGSYYGPLEIVGLPGKTVRKQLNESFALAMAPSTP